MQLGKDAAIGVISGENRDEGTIGSNRGLATTDTDIRFRPRFEYRRLGSGVADLLSGAISF